VGAVERIYLAASHGAPPVRVERIDVVEGMGVAGDRNFGETLWRGQNLTLIEAEAVEAVAAISGKILDPGAARRNLVTRGVRLNELVGVEFAIGEVVLRGIETCEPCTTLAGHLGWEAKSTLKRFRGRGGLRCDCLTSGSIEVGMQLALLP